MANRKWKNINLEWYAIRWSNDKIQKVNVLGHGFIDEIHTAVNKNKITDYSTLREFVRRHFSYYYWCKSEHEIAVGGLFSKHPEEFEKIDIYYQLEMNLDRIVEYINKEINLNF